MKRLVMSMGWVRRLVDQAALSRRNANGVKIAFALIALYNVVGILDIISTNGAIGRGVGEEVNPIMRASMIQFGAGWFAPKLMLQALISAMVVWFPDRIVLSMFFVALSANMLIVANNFLIYFSA